MTNQHIQNIRLQMIVLFCSLYFPLFAQPRELTPQSEVSVLTCGSGDDLYALFGHTALRVKDANQGVDLVFNYGMFDFNTPNFYTKFIKGDLKYHLAADRFYDFINYYSYKDRTVTEQKLNLSLEEKNKIWNTIWAQMNSDEKYYHYKFIENNCTTKVVDLLNQNTKYQIETDFESNNLSYRKILNNYLQMQYFPQLGINLVFGRKVDKDNELLFLPEQFLKGISLTKQIEASKEVLYQSTVDRTNKVQYGKWVFFMFLAVLAWFSSKKWVRKTYFLVTFFIGTLVLGIQSYSLHKEVLSNPMALFYNPLYVLMLFPISRKKTILIVLILLSLVSLCFLSVESIVVLLPLIILHSIFVNRELKEIDRK